MEKSLEFQNISKDQQDILLTSFCYQITPFPSKLFSLLKGRTTETTTQRVNCTLLL